MMDAITEKIAAGARLDRAEGLFLWEQADLLELGQLAQQVRFDRHPEPLVTYVIDTNLNYTNICDAYCTFCAFYRPPGSGAEQGAYTHSIDEIVEQVGRAAEQGCTTVLMQGGLHPDLPFSYYVDMVRAVRARPPRRDAPLLVSAGNFQNAAGFRTDIRGNLRGALGSRPTHPARGRRRGPHQ